MQQTDATERSGNGSGRVGDGRLDGASAEGVRVLLEEEDVRREVRDEASAEASVVEAAREFHPADAVPIKNDAREDALAELRLVQGLYFGRSSSESVERAGVVREQAARGAAGPDAPDAHDAADREVARVREPSDVAPPRERDVEERGGREPRVDGDLPVVRVQHARARDRREAGIEMLDRFEGLILEEYGFLYHRDNNFPQDDLCWFLLRKG